ncbi:tRNA splicing endonuclease subunit sen2 [Gryganskiella cystojenkinii]|nr:tRNA splicing endonuclease subunit sen2 [Gryganskiella cystojenkinii]
MAAKRNANKRQQYAIPFPLPFLQDQQARQLQQQNDVKNASPSTVISATHEHHNLHGGHWSPIDPLLVAIRYIYKWSKKHRSSQPGSDRNQQELIQTEFHPQGEAVWVLRSKDMKSLFQQGFFGKGTLSRSEPTWKLRTTAESGGAQGLSLEEITRQRRIERALLKKEKQLNPQGTPTSRNSSPLTSNSPSNTHGALSPIVPHEQILTSNATKVTDVIAGTINSKDFDQSALLDNDEDYEHLQLSLEEAFFLVFAVECISVFSSSGSKSRPMSIQECWLQFAKSSLSISSTLTLHPISNKSHFQCKADNPFIVRYVAYHYFRSQGWIVKDGLKYGTDFLLYRKGMVFGHSHYAAKVIPCSSIDQETTAEQKSGHTLHPQRSGSLLTPIPGSIRQLHGVYSWQWLLTLNRVVAQVQKTVLLCHVVLPKDVQEIQLSHPHLALPLYQVVELIVKRFIPEKNRA